MDHEGGDLLNGTSALTGRDKREVISQLCKHEDSANQEEDYCQISNLLAP